MKRTRRVVAMGGLLVSVGASAGEADAWDSPGVLLGVVEERVESRISNAAIQSGWQVSVDLGATLPFGHDHGLLKVFLRQRVDPDKGGTSAVAGYRGFFGDEWVRTFWDLDLALHARPDWSLGPRIGFGLQLELTRWLGAYAAAAGQITGGDGYRFSGELGAGLHLRWVAAD